MAQGKKDAMTSLTESDVAWPARGTSVVGAPLVGAQHGRATTRGAPTPTLSGPPRRAGLRPAGK